MPSTGTARGLAKAPASVNFQQGSHKPKPEVPVSVRQGAYCFNWIVALVSVNSVFEVLGSNVRHFTGLGAIAMIGRLAQSSGISVMQVIVSFWVAAGFLLIGYLASEGRKLAFAAGMAVYAADGALMVAAGDYLGAVFHALMLYGIYRGFTALGQWSNSEPSKAASAGHAG
jgi:hypothetical protein